LTLVSAADQSQLSGATWALLTVGDARAIDDVEVHLTFGTDGALHGSDGCNQFKGTYREEDGSLVLHLGASTLMECAERVMHQAQAFADAVTATAAATITDGLLELLDARGRVIATFGLRSPHFLTDAGWSATGVNNGAGGVTGLVSGSEITARFGIDGRITGNAGINTYGATYTIDGAAMSIGPVRTTRMAGEPDVMEQERQFLEALGRVAEFTLDEEGRLELRDEGEALQVSFVLAEPSADDTAPGAQRPGEQTLDGTVTYRARVALPEDAVVEVSLQDTSRTDAPAVEIARQTIASAGRQVPIPFCLSFDPAAIDEGMTYTVRAQITVGGELTWTTTTHTPVLTRGAPASDVDIWVEHVSAPRE
jgi:heat shock protein HslJ/uncharacterized lipoprotein YbaY